MDGPDCSVGPVCEGLMSARCTARQACVAGRVMRLFATRDSRRTLDSRHNEATVKKNGFLAP